MTVGYTRSFASALSKVGLTILSVPGWSPSVNLVSCLYTAIEGSNMTASTGESYAEGAAAAFDAGTFAAAEVA